MQSPIAAALQAAPGPRTASLPVGPTPIQGVPGGPELFVILLIIVVPVALVVVVVLGIAGVRVLGGDGAGGGRERASGRDPALEELRLALARGDVDEEEFERRRELLAESAPGDPGRDPDPDRE